MPCNWLGLNLTRAAGAAREPLPGPHPAKQDARRLEGAPQACGGSLHVQVYQTQGPHAQPAALFLTADGGLGLGEPWLPVS